MPLHVPFPWVASRKAGQPWALSQNPFGIHLRSFLISLCPALSSILVLRRILTGRFQYAHARHTGPTRIFRRLEFHNNFFLPFEEFSAQRQGLRSGTLAATKAARALGRELCIVHENIERSPTPAAAGKTNTQLLRLARQHLQLPGKPAVGCSES